VRVTIESLSPVKRRIGVELPTEEVRAEIEEAYRGLRQRARIKGFRPGRVPRAILERHYGAQVQSEVVGRLIQDSYARALAEHHLHAVARPEIVEEEVRPEVGLRYSATIEVMPEFEVVGHDGIETERVVAPVGGAAVDGEIERIRQSMAHMVRRDDRDTVERGDLIEIAYTGVVDGHVLRGATADSRVIEVGSQTFPPPFEERLVGLRRGETVHVDVSYPAHHPSPEIAGKTVTFRVAVKEIGRKELPALDDDFAKDHGECGSLAELRERVRRALEVTAEREADERVRAAIVRQLVERNPIEVPEALVDRRLQTMMREFGIPGSDSVSNPELSAELDRIRTDLRQRAGESVRSALLLERLASQQRIEVSEAEIDERIGEMLRAASRERERLAGLYRSPEARREVGGRLAQEKALAWVTSRAVVKEAL